MRKELADFIKQFDVGSRIRTRRTTDRRLVDRDHLVHQFDALKRTVVAGFGNAAVKFFAKFFFDDVVDQRAFATAADAGDADEFAQRDFNVDVFQVVVSRSIDAENVVAVEFAALIGDFDLQAA